MSVSVHESSALQRFVNWARSTRTKLKHEAKAATGAYKEEARDLLLDGAVRDVQHLAGAIANQAIVISDLTERLQWYETTVPHLKKARSALVVDKKRRQRKAKKEADKRALAIEDSAAETAPEAQAG